MSETAIERIEAMLHRRAGLRLDPHLKVRAHRCIREEATAHGFSSMDEYITSLLMSEDLFQELLDRITVQETGFFREPLHFESLCRWIRDRDEPPGVIWSAGCATGQEPYSIAMAFTEAGIHGWRIVATDVSVPALAQARKGRYTERELKGLNPERRQQHLVAVGKKWEMRESLREQIVFSHHNLAGDSLPVPRGSCTAIFCRNVLIYFSLPQLQHVLTGFSAALNDNGRLFTASAESLWLATDLFHVVRTGAIFTYSKPRPGEARSSRRLREVERRQPEPPLRPAAEKALPAPHPERRVPRVVNVLSEGEAHLAAGAPDQAVDLFRQAVYLDPDNAVLHFYLGVALEAAGDLPASNRAYAAALHALRSGQTGGVDAVLEGYSVEDLKTVLEFKLGSTT